MREEIAKWYFGFSSWDAVDPRLKVFCYKRADQLLAILRGRVLAVGNPYMGQRSGAWAEVFEDCRREVLALFGEGE